MNSSNKNTGSQTPVSIGKVSTKAQRELQAWKASKAVERANDKKEKERLQHAADAERAVTRKLDKLRLQDVERRTSSLLGGMVLTALMRRGMSGPLLTGDDVAALPAAQLADVRMLLSKVEQGDAALKMGSEAQAEKILVDPQLDLEI